MEPEIVLSIFNVILGNAIAKVPVDLEGCFSRISLYSSSVFNEGEGETGAHRPHPHEDKERHMDGIRTEMQNALQLVENTACPSCNDIDPYAPDVRELLEVSYVLVIIVCLQI